MRRLFCNWICLFVPHGPVPLCPYPLSVSCSAYVSVCVCELMLTVRSQGHDTSQHNEGASAWRGEEGGWASSNQQPATSSSSSKWEEQQEGVVDTHSLLLPNWMLSMLMECCHGASLTLQLSWTHTHTHKQPHTRAEHPFDIDNGIDISTWTCATSSASTLGQPAVRLSFLLFPSPPSLYLFLAAHTHYGKLWHWQCPGNLPATQKVSHFLTRSGFVAAIFACNLCRNMPTSICHARQLNK